MKPWELAKILDIPISQIYRWNREGIGKESKYWDKVHEILPDLEPTKDYDGKRYNAGRRKKTQLTLSETDIPSPPEERPRPVGDFPRIKFRKRT